MRFFLIFFLIISGQASVCAEDKLNLFIHSSNHGDLTPRQEKALDYIKKQKMNSKVKTVEINTQAFSVPHVELNISSTFTLSADMKSYDTVRDTKQWLGNIVDSPDSVTFVIRNGNVTGTIQNADRIYSVKPIGGGLHAIIEQDPTKFPEDHPAEYNALEKSPYTESVKPAEDNAKDINETNAGDLINNNRKNDISVFVAYTTAVGSVLVDPVALIELAVKETNESYANSSMPVKISLAGTQKLSYSESNHFSTNLSRLSERSDGFLDEIHGIRDSFNADIVVLLVNNDSYCGQADAILANEDSAFAIVFHECATGHYSFAHEIGHLQGARHNLEVDNASSPFRYGHGFILNEHRVRTVMSYDCPRGCKRVQYWSNPKVMYDGIPMGKSDTSDNSRVLQETWLKLSGFR